MYCPYANTEVTAPWGTSKKDFKYLSLAEGTGSVYAHVSVLSQAFTNVKYNAYAYGIAEGHTFNLDYPNAEFPYVTPKKIACGAYIDVYYDYADAYGDYTW
jgi:hypothetical protein